MNNKLVYAGAGAAGIGTLYFLRKSIGAFNPFSGSGGGGSDPPAPGSGYSSGTKPGFSSSVTQRARFVSALKSKMGKPYIWGHTGPDSFDCSGLVHWAYKSVGKIVPRLVTEQSDQAPYWIVFERAERMTDIKHLLKKGDCIGVDYEFGGRFSHVIVYIGGNKFLHASGKEACPCEGSRCKVVKDSLSDLSGFNVRSIYSWV